jgi:hypothetical protein
MQRSEVGATPRRTGVLWIAAGAPFLLLGGVAIALLLQWIPLDWVLPPNMRATGPMTADWRATFWLGFAFVFGAAAVAHGADQVRNARGTWKRFVALLAAGSAALGAIVGLLALG